MSTIRRTLKRTTLPVLIVLCLAALSVSYAFAGEAQRPLATQVIGDPDAAVTGKFAVGTATPGNKALTVVGVIDFLGAGTVHNYFTEGTGNNMQINTNVDEANTVLDATKSQWKLVLGSSLDWFSIRRSPAGATYNEDALFFIQGATGRVGIATVDTNNQAAIPFTPSARLDVQTASGDAIHGIATSSSDLFTSGIYGESRTTNDGIGVYGRATATIGIPIGVLGRIDSPAGYGMYGYAAATTGGSVGVEGITRSPSGMGVYGDAVATTGENYGIYGQSASSDGYGVYGRDTATWGGVGVYGESAAPGGHGVEGYASSTDGFAHGVYGTSDSTAGRGVLGWATANTGTGIGVYGGTDSPTGYGVMSTGKMLVTGDFEAMGTKAAIVETGDYGWRKLYAMESPQNWFEDFGRATLSSGEAVVPIEPVFAQTVNLGETYHVFLTPLGGGCTLYVTEMSSTSFTVRSNEGSGCEVTFDYRIIAPRLDYEDLRLKEAGDPAALAASIPEVK